MKCKDCNVGMYQLDPQVAPEVLCCPECGNMAKSEESIRELKEALKKQQANIN